MKTIEVGADMIGVFGVLVAGWLIGILGLFLMIWWLIGGGK